MKVIVKKLEKLSIEKASVIILSIILISIFYYISSMYYQSVLYFNRTPWDGTFQTLFPLRKMDVGEYPGRDYFYFHGNGIPYLLYPIYFILKVQGAGEILSALHSTFILNTIALFLPIYLLIKKYYSTEISLFSLIIIIVLFDFLPFVGAYFSPLFLGAPMGLRFLPHMVMAIAISHFISSYKGQSSVGFLLKPIAVLALYGCLGVYCGAEQGFYALAGAGLALFFFFILRKKYLISILAPILLVLFFALFLVITSLVFFQSLEHLAAISKISNDQVWVFGVYPNSFFSSFSELFSLDNMSAIPSQLMSLISIIFMFVLIALYRFKKMNESLFFALTVLFLGAVLSWVSNVGYIGAHQTALFMRFILIGCVPVGIIFLLKAGLYESN